MKNRIGVKLLLALFSFAVILTVVISVAASVLEQLEKIKRENKERLAAYAATENKEEIARLRESSDLGRFVIDTNKVLMDLDVERFGEPCLDMADPAAMAAALYPECILECDKYYCEMDVSNGPSYGAMLVDKYRFSGKEPNAWVCSKLDPEKYKDYIYRTVNKTFR